MSRKIIVDPAKLETAASTIDSQSSDYKQIYEQLFTEVGAMASAWQGADNVAFTQQIEGFREDMLKMYQLMVEYSEFLKTSATTYKATQNEIINQAKKLTN